MTPAPFYKLCKKTYKKTDVFSEGVPKLNYCRLDGLIGGGGLDAGLIAGL